MTCGCSCCTAGKATSGTLPSSASSITPSSIGAERARDWSAEAPVAATATRASMSAQGCQEAFHAPTVLPRSSARRERSSSMRRPSSRPMRGAQPSNSLARVMSGRRCLGSFAGSASIDDATFGSGQGDHLFGQLEQRELLGIADVDGEMLAGVGEAEDAVDEVVDVTERAGLPTVAEHRDGLAGERLAHEGGDRTAVVGAHARAVGVEDAHDRGVDALLAVVGHGEGLGVALGLVVDAARADRVDVAPVALGLRVDVRVAVDLARRGEQEARAVRLGQPEHVVRAVGADLERVQRQAQVVDRARRAGEVEHAIDRLGDLQVVRRDRAG